MSGDTPLVERPLAGVRALTAPNPSPMTGTGTRTYLLGTGKVAVVDPGPDLPAHGAAILDALTPGERVVAVLVTHAHRDHVGLLPWLQAATGAPSYGFGPLETGRSPEMARLAGAAPLGGGEGVVPGFDVDTRLADGAVLSGADWRVEALYTPGHLCDHLSFAFSGDGGGALFTGDLVMGWASTLISPPDGDLAAYRRSLTRLAARQERLYLPGHGAPVADGPALIAEQLAHRDRREAAILAALGETGARIEAIVARVYRDTPPALHPAAARNVLAHLLDLLARGAVETRDPPGPTAHYLRTETP